MLGVCVAAAIIIVLIIIASSEKAEGISGARKE